MAGTLEGLEDGGGFAGWGAGRAGVGRDEWNNPPRRWPKGSKKGQDETQLGDLEDE